MTKLLLFALLSSVSAFGQAYSDSVTQNSPGNYGRPVPYASVQVCNIADTATPCTQKVNTFTDDSLSVACTQTAGSGVLTGAPASGANCNNPGIADANGNFTIYVVPGQYRICTYANNWLCQNVSIGGSGGGIPFACASAVNGSIVGMTSTTTSSCDPNGVTDFIGHWTSQSYRATGAFNGTVELTGGLADPTNPPDTNSVAFLAPTAVPTPFYLRPPSSVGAVGQCLGLLSQNIGTNGTIDALQWQSCLASPTTFQTNGVNNLSQSILNIVQGANCTVTNASGGNVTVTCTGAAAAPQASNPTAPTLTTNGSAGSTSYSYAVVGCEDGPTCAYHSVVTSATAIATGNATLTSSNSINIKTFADTLYGYRCYNIYRTASSGTPSSVGLIGNCVWKSFIDTGLAGDGATAPATNTTVLDANGLTAPLPGCNKIPSAPWGIDGVPCSPNAFDDEFTWGNGTWTPGDANNPFWTLLNLGTATISLTNGMVSFSLPTTAADSIHCLLRPLPSAPYFFNVVPYVSSPGQASLTNPVAVGFYESATGKLELFDVGTRGDFQVAKWTNTTTLSANYWASNVPQSNYPFNIKVGRDGSNNLIYKHSQDGVVYATDESHVMTTFFTTAPDNFALCANSKDTTASKTTVTEYDYVRETSN